MIDLVDVVFPPHSHLEFYTERGIEYGWQFCHCEACAHYRVRRELEAQGLIGNAQTDTPPGTSR